MSTRLLPLCVSILCVPVLGLAAESPGQGALRKLQVGSDTVTIFRDTYGVPRVFAQTAHGLFVGDGYAVAEDRAWQMEKYRLDAEGRLAEVFGDSQVEHDKEVRRDGMIRDEWHKEFEQLPPNIQEAFSAYAEGVNRYFEEAAASSALPEEFAKHNWKPQPWVVEDSIAIGGMMGRRFGASGTEQLRNEAVVAFLTKKLGSRDAALKVFNDLAWVDDPAAIPTVAAEDLPQKAAREGTSLVPKRSGQTFARTSTSNVAPEFFLLLQAAANSEAVYASARQLGLATKWGSYSWAIAPSKSVSGNAMLAGGPQMGFSTPQIAHEIQLTGAGYNVMGMGFAGIPGVLIGANEHLAWTSTSGASYNEDVFAEELRSGDQHQYLYRGEYRQMEHRVEEIRVKDKPAIPYDVYRTVHGPIIGWSPDKRVAYSKQMAYFGKEWKTTIAFLELNTATSIKNIPALAAQIASNHNIIAATQDGDIGFWHGGLFPTYRNGADPRLPLRGTGEDDWTGILPFDRVPQTINPKGGIIFNWNNKPGAGWKNYSVPTWGVAFHISNIRSALERRLKESGQKLSFTQVRDVAPEIGRRNYIADWLKSGLLDAASRAGAGLGSESRRAIEYLRHWDNQAVDGSVAQTIFDAWYKRLRQDIFAPVLGDLGNKDAFEEFVNPSSMYHALAGARSSVPLSRDYLVGKTADQVRLKALSEALQQLAKEKGPDMTGWGYQFDWIKFDPLPALPWYSRGTYIQVVELAKPTMRGGWILPPGQSEDPKSPHYSDQLSLAGWWMYAPMRLMNETEAVQKAVGSKQ